MEKTKDVHKQGAYAANNKALNRLIKFACKTFKLYIKTVCDTVQR